MVLVSFDFGGVYAAVVDDYQIDLRSILHIDVGQQFLAGNAPSAIGVGERILLRCIADLGSKFDRSDLGSVKIIQVNANQMRIVIMRPLGMAAGRFEVHHVAAVGTMFLVSVVVVRIRRTRRSGTGRCSGSRLFAAQGRGAN